MGKLNPTQVRNLAEPGRYMDGDGLMLEIKPSGSKTWLVRLQIHGRRRDYGLGSFKDVSLSEARDKAREFRRQLRGGIDPLEAKRKAALHVPTFREAAIAVHGEHQGSWKNTKHGAQWLSTLESYAFPLFGDVRLDMVDTGHVRDALAAIWLTKSETARRVRQRIVTVLDYGHGKGWREQPFVMASVHKALPRQPKKDGHFSAMPFAGVPNLMERLRERTSIGRLALEALILTATRSGEIRGACWRELDLDRATWTIPAERMKAAKQHIVPLSTDAVAAFRQAAEYRRATDDLVFHGLKRGKPLSDMTLLKVLRDLGEPYTVHGFRSAFRDWVAEETNVSGEIAEAALAHAVANRVEAAYRRTDFLEKRSKLMEAWGKYCAGGTTKVVRLASAR